MLSTIFRSWKRMLVGAGVGLGITSLALLLVTVLTFQLAFDEHAMAVIAYAMLIYGSTFGAALGLLTRPADYRQR